ncbi:hypothetical protein PYCC9005_001389 [Savitreella phatthalungensis]
MQLPFGWACTLETVSQNVDPDLRSLLGSLQSLQRLGLDNAGGQGGGSFPLSLLLSNGHASTMYSAAGNFEDIYRVYYRRYTLVHEDGGNNTLDFAVPVLREGEDAEIASQEAGSAFPHVTEKDEAARDRAKTETSLPPRTTHMTDGEASSWGDDREGVLLVLFHGLSGGSHESYVRATVEGALDMHRAWTRAGDGAGQRPLDVVAFNARGCARSKVTSSQFWSALRTEDVSAALRALRQRFPRRKIICVGYSLGANILVNYLGLHADESRETVDLAVSVSNPWTLPVSNHYLNGSYIGAFYSRAMTGNLKKLLRRHASMLKDIPNVSVERALKARDLPGFDDAFTSRSAGFKNALEYYDASSSSRRLPSVVRPLIVLNAVDDPITGPLIIPREACDANPRTALLATSRGGHIGWYGSEAMHTPKGTPAQPRRLFVDLVVDLCKAALADKLPAKFASSSS